uniref:Uncharacterized protein n=1 Tax=Romanomermis culicivorax TaxID=13658 RepID=A0A915JMF7_ROMCU
MDCQKIDFCIIRKNQVLLINLYQEERNRIIPKKPVGSVSNARSGAWATTDASNSPVTTHNVAGLTSNDDARISS